MEHEEICDVTEPKPALICLVETDVAKQQARHDELLNFLESTHYLTHSKLYHRQFRELGSLKLRLRKLHPKP